MSAVANHRRERCDREDLAGHHDLRALLTECFAEDGLALAEPVDLGGIEQRHAQRTSAVHDVAGAAGRVGVAVAPFT